MQQFLTYLAVMLVGFFVAVMYGFKTKEFRLSEYTALFIFPFLLICWYAYTIDTLFLSLFVFFAAGGMIMEYILGWSYHRAIGKRLWEYRKYPINGYTSWLAVPFWGNAGVLMYLFVRAISS